MGYRKLQGTPGLSPSISLFPTLELLAWIWQGVGLEPVIPGDTYFDQLWEQQRGMGDQPKTGVV